MIIQMNGVRYIIYILLSMKRLFNDIDGYRAKLGADATGQGHEFDGELFDLILSGKSREELNEEINQRLDGKAKDWHLAKLVPMVEVIHS